MIELYVRTSQVSVQVKFVTNINSCNCDVCLHCSLPAKKGLLVQASILKICIEQQFELVNNVIIVGVNADSLIDLGELLQGI